MSLPRRAWLPQARRAPDPAETLFWAWALAAGVALFAAWWMRQAGWWRRLVEGDPSGISIGIAVLAAVLTLWCGRRAWRLWQESLPGGAWACAYLADRRAGLPQCAELLSERAHGPHETAWWFASAAIKLGLLGTVVGFIVMAMQIADTPGFEIEQIQALLQQMTRGMAIALYTTLAGLVANLWLGLQLMLLDRMADRVVAGILQSAAAQR
ncbi:MotA/TolQ/ExbB proton channel family protein [Caldimonas tepidiphila]|uniref:MotA/TolQ/ExbB proton channel family protein n=1 Tax=Caldimonas tepidiphila TaxID=2315841 RepID=UPI000E5C1AED|nr:MotA/TolQ/ExbB proton channel family protein [Caldimonas tepidiphila]